MPGSSSKRSRKQSRKRRESSRSRKQSRKRRESSRSLKQSRERRDRSRRLPSRSREETLLLISAIRRNPALAKRILRKIMSEGR